MSYCPFVTLDDFPNPTHSEAYGHAFIEVAQRVVAAPGDTEAQRLLGLLPRLLLSDQRLARTRASGRTHDEFTGRVRELLNLRVRGLWRDFASSTRRRATTRDDDERVRRDALRLARLREWGRCGRVLMRGEVAQGSASMLQSMRDLHPDGRAELEEWARSGHPDAPPAAEHLDRDIFMHLIGADADGSIRRGSAADAAGHRWEHLAAVVETGGADALYALCDELFRGTAIARSAGMTWIFGGRLIALRKPGDSPERRRLRPIGMGTILLRLIGSCAARQFAPTFGAQFDPATQEDVDEDSEMWRLLQAGVACPGGTQQVQHTIRELLAEHPDWLVMKIDARNAFNTCSRATFFRRLLERAPGLYSWVHCCYSAPTRRYVRMEDGSFQVVWSTAGTTQGDPLGPALFSFAMLALQEQLAALVSAGQLFYLDDGHCVGPAETLAEFASAIVQPDGEHDMERTTGCAVEVTKCSVWGHDHIEYSSPTEYPAERTREEFDMQAASEGRDIFIGEDEEVDGVLDRQYGGDPLHASRHLSRRAAEARSRLRELFPSRLHGMRGLREPDSLGAEEAIQERAASRGLVVLGSPVCGTHDFMRAELESTIARAREYVDRAREILLPPHPDAYLGLMRVTLPPRFVHHCLCVPPSLVASAAAAFDQLVLRAYTTVVGSLQSDHLPASDLALMPRQFGGQDFRSSASVAEALYLGAHALSTHRVWRRAPLLRALPSSRLTMPAWPTGQHRTHPPERTIREHMCLTHREEVRAGRDRFEGTLLHAAAWQSLIPEGMRIPSEQPTLAQLRDATVRNLGRDLSRAVWVLQLHQAIEDCTTPYGEAVVRERTTRGAMQWVAARPVGPEERVGWTRRWAEPVDVITAHQGSLLLRPTVLADSGCAGCGGADVWGSDARHFGSCPRGIRSSRALHHPIRDVLVEMLRSVVGHARVLPELARHRRYSAIRRPDIIVTDFYGFRRHLILDVKSLDCSTHEHAVRNHAEDRALAGHVEAERALPAYYTTYRAGGVQHHVPRAIGDSTLVCAAVGRFGGIGVQLSTLMAELARRRAGTLSTEERRAERARGYSFLGYWRHRLSLAVQVSVAIAIRATRAEREGSPHEDDVEGGEGGDDDDDDFAPPDDTTTEEYSDEYRDDDDDDDDGADAAQPARTPAALAQPRPTLTEPHRGGHAGYVHGEAADAPAVGDDAPPDTPDHHGDDRDDDGDESPVLEVTCPACGLAYESELDASCQCGDCLTRHCRSCCPEETTSDGDYQLGQRTMDQRRAAVEMQIDTRELNETGTQPEPRLEATQLEPPDDYDDEATQRGIPDGDGDMQGGADSAPAPAASGVPLADQFDHGARPVTPPTAERESRDGIHTLDCHDRHQVEAHLRQAAVQFSLVRGIHRTLDQLDQRRAAAREQIGPRELEETSTQPGLQPEATQLEPPDGDDGEATQRGTPDDDDDMQGASRPATPPSAERGSRDGTHTLDHLHGLQASPRPASPAPSGADMDGAP